MVEIVNIIAGSPCDSCGIRKGDTLLKINGHCITDVLDYMYYAAESDVRLDILRNGEELVFEIKKNEYDDLGLGFSTFLMDSKQRCSNRCIFCFIDQMPPNMRETLYF
ncbi:MAG: PDZ domain-containing protein, partial [Ruminococcus sp.]|nr:PDZ domain-containing protein [Ruminococcus sp.]